MLNPIKGLKPKKSFVIIRTKILTIKSNLFNFLKIVIKMANKENKKTEVKNTVVDETNVLDTIKNGNKMPEGLADEVKKEIAEEEKKKKKSILKEKIMKAGYWNKKELLQLRQRRREEKATKEALTRSKEQLDKLASGEITPTEYEDLLKKSQQEKTKAIQDSNEEYRKELRELQNSLEGDYVWDWDRY